MDSKQTAETYLFVYGTLMSGTGHPMGRLLRANARLVCRATLQGALYLVEPFARPAGSGQTSRYPAGVPSNDPAETVHGELYALRGAGILEALDAYEECGPEFPEPQEYVRELAWVETDNGRRVQAWVYLYNRPLGGLTRIPDGRWYRIGT